MKTFFKIAGLIAIVLYFTACVSRGDIVTDSKSAWINSNSHGGLYYCTAESLPTCYKPIYKAKDGEF